MKAILYSIFLIFTISSDLINSGYMIFCDDHKIEFSKDFSTEKESKENTEMDEEACELSLYHFSLKIQQEDISFLHDNHSLKNNTTYHSIPSPPPDNSLN